MHCDCCTKWIDIFEYYGNGGLCDMCKANQNEPTDLT